MSQLILCDFTLENICGNDCRYEDDYLQLEQEIDKLTNVYSDAIDWNFIYDKTQNLLENETKDFKLATWWLYSVWQLYSYRGLDENIKLYNDFLQKYNDLLFPKSIKSKVNVLSWFEESLTNDILNDKNKISSELYASIYSKLLELGDTLKNLLNEDRKIFRKILDYLSPYYHEVQQKNTQNEQKENEISTHSKPLAQNSFQNNNISSENDLKNYERETKKAISTLTQYYREQNIHDLKTIKMTRFLSWCDIDDYPYVQNGKTTLIYAPSEIETDQLQSYIDEQNYIEALNLCEEIIEVSPFWLEGHYISYDLFTKLNKHNEALEVKNQLINFVQIFKGIEEYSFNENIPFASKNTQRWIKEQQSVTADQNGSNISTTDHNDEQLNTILELAQNKKTKEAMLLLEKNYNSAQTQEDKFFWRLQHAQLAIEFNKNKVALALLEDLLEQIKIHNLNEWNPKLASKVYVLILNTFTNIDIEQAVLENVYNSLCKTDVSNAIEIKI